MPLAVKKASAVNVFAVIGEAASYLDAYSHPN